MATILEGTSLIKRFGDFTALDEVDISVRKGEIHAILGENGAGKSTLMKVLYGVYVPEGGSIRMNGHSTVMHPPNRARAQGVGMVFQDFRLIPALTVLENIALGMNQQSFFINKRKLSHRISEISQQYQLDVNPNAYLWELDLGQQQRVEIVKALLQGDTKVIIFDEPTSVLTPHEVDAFLAMLGRLKADGYGILLITHKIREVIACADRVTVLRLGKVVAHIDKATAPNQTLLEDDLISAMIGSKQLPQAPERRERSAEFNRPALQLKQMAVRNDQQQTVIENIHVSLNPGEIVGLAGISGNGQRELLETLYGLRAPASGQIWLDNEEVTKWSVEKRLAAGMVYATEDPIREAVVPGMTILEHMVLSGLKPETKGLDIDWKKMSQTFHSLDIVKTLRVADANRLVETLSGGNVQRMILARAISKAPKVLLIAYPSRGLDIATTRATQELLLSLRDQGTAILLLSEDLTELFEISDRLIVLSNKQILGPYDPQQTDPYRVGHIMLEGEESA